MRLAALLCAALLSLVLLGCGGGSPSLPVVAANDTLLSEATGTLGVAGGTVRATDGTTLEAPAGALPGDRAITVRRLASPSQTGNPDNFAVDLTGVADATAPVTLTVPAPAGFTQAEMSGRLLDLTSGAPTPQAVTLNSAAGTVSTTITFGGRHARGLLDPFRFMLLMETSYTPQRTERVIRMPFYDQIGGSCWAANAKILLRALKPQPFSDSIGDVLKEVGVGDTDFGGDLTDFTNKLPPFLNNKTGVKAHMRGFLDMTHLKWRILRELDNNHPLIMRHNSLGHAFLIVGYQDNGETLILHDTKGKYPANPTEGGMYCPRSYTWLTGLAAASDVEHILWLDTPITAPATLQTLGLPSTAEVGGLDTEDTAAPRVAFEKPGVKAPVSQGRLHFKPSAPDAYEWYADGMPPGAVETISMDAVELVCALPVYNAAATAARVQVKVDVSCEGDVLATREGAVLDMPGVSAASDAGKAPTVVTLTIPMTELRKPALAKAGKQDIKITAGLYDGSGKRLDAWAVNATLGLGPQIRLIAPATQELGKTVVITGSGFGATRVGTPLKAAGRAIGNSYIQSWADTRIELRVPWDAPTTCDTTVTVDGLTSNSKTFTTTFPAFAAGNYELRAFFVQDPNGGTLSMRSMGMTVTAGGATTIGSYGFPITTAYGTGTIVTNNSRANWGDPVRTYEGFDCVVPVLWPSTQANYYGNFRVRYTGSGFTGTAVRPDGSTFPVAVDAMAPIAVN